MSADFSRRFMFKLAGLGQSTRDFPVELWPANTASHGLAVYHRHPPQQRILFTI